MTATCSTGTCPRKAVVTIRDGRSFCKRHADHLPPFLRRKAGQPSGVATRAVADTYKPPTFSRRWRL